MKNIIVLFLLTLVFSCHNRKDAETISSVEQELTQLQQIMSGYFTSESQAEADSAYYNISLTMKAIWENTQQENTKWLYVEQAVTANIKKPYRQRVYQLTQVNETTFESKVFELPQPEKYIHAWEDKEIFASLSPEDLIEREGCSVFLERDMNGCYVGKTKEKSCSSTLRGASFATSIVTICDNKIESWDQGWDDKGNQVWGATKGAYVFEKVN